MRKLIYILFLIGLPVFGQTTYYVSETGGGDTLATITEVNALTLTAGDSVLFHRGDVWNVVDDAALNVGATEDGTSGSRIVIGAYGSGAKPVITCRDTITGSDNTGNWTDQGGNIWTFNFGATGAGNGYFRLWVDGVEMTKAENTTVTITDRFAYSNPNVYFYSVGNPATTYSLFEYSGFPTVSNAVLVYGDYVTIRDLDIRGGYLLFYVENTISTIIDSCDIGNSSMQMGVYWNGGDNGEILNCTFDTKSEVAKSTWGNPTYTEDGINIRGEVDTLLIHDNYFKNWGHGAVHPQGGLNNANDTLTHLWIYDNEFTGPDRDYGYAINYVSSTNTLPDNKAFRNYIHHIPIYVGFSCDGVEFFYNVIDSVFGNAYHSDAWRSSGAFFYQNSAGAAFGAENNKIYNNTFVDCQDAAICLSNLTGTNVKDNNSFVNNIIYNCGYEADGDLSSHHFSIYFDFNGYEYWGVQTFRNNAIYSSYHPTGDSLIYYGKRGGPFHSDNWTGITGFNADNINESYTYPDTIQNNFLLDASPFVDYEGGDYRLATSVNAINAGVDVGLTTDFLGNAISGLPDVGAYEYTDVTPDPDPTPVGTIQSFSIGGGKVLSTGSKVIKF